MLLFDHFWRLNEKTRASKECYAPHAMYQPLLPDLEPKTLPSAPCFFCCWQNFEDLQWTQSWDFKGFEGHTELLLLSVQFDMFTIAGIRTTIFITKTNLCVDFSSAVLFIKLADVFFPSDDLPAL